MLFVKLPSCRVCSRDTTTSLPSLPPSPVPSPSHAQALEEARIAEEEEEYYKKAAEEAQRAAEEAAKRKVTAIEVSKSIALVLHKDPKP